MILFPQATNCKILEIHDISTPHHASDANSNKNNTLMLMITDGRNKYRAIDREKLQNLCLKSTLVLLNVLSKNNILLLTKDNTRYGYPLNISVINDEFEDDSDDVILLDLVDDFDSNQINQTAKSDILSVKSKISGDLCQITITASIEEICKMGLSKAGFQQFIILKDDSDTIKVVNSSYRQVKVSEDLINQKLGINAETARSIRKTDAGTGKLVQMLADWYSWLENLKNFEFVLRVGEGVVEWTH